MLGLDLNIEKGNIHLENVKLKESALAALDLPVDVSFGIVKHVVIKVPWTALTKKPTVVIIDGIYALIRNRTDFNGDEAAQQKLQRALHQRHIDAYEKSLADEEERDIELEKNDGKKKQDGADALISSKFLVSIVDNLQVTIRNLHLRYVDETSFIGHRCSIGFAIREITVYPFDRRHRRKVDPANTKAYRQALVAYYHEVSPQVSDAEIDAKLKKWDRKEDVFFDQLEARYGKRPDFQLEVASDSPKKSKKPKFILKKIEINDVILYIDDNVESAALQFKDWDKPDVICGIMGAVFKPMTDGDTPSQTDLRQTVETSQWNTVGWVKPSTHVLQPLNLMVIFKSYQSTANRDLPLFEISVGGAKSTAETASEESNPTLSLRVTPGQFGALAAIADNLTNYRKFSRLRGTRPKSTRPSNDPRGWWRYIIHAVVIQVRDHLGSRSWIRLIELLRVKRQYLKLYSAKVKQKGSKKTAVDRALQQLDATLPLQQAKYFRTIIRRDNKKQRLMKAEARKEKKALGNWFERKFANKEMRRKLEMNKKQLRAAQKEWANLQEQIDSSYVEVTPWDQMHAEDIVAIVDVTIDVKVSLLTDKREELVAVHVQGVEVYIKAMAAFQEVHVGIVDLAIRDMSTEGTQFPFIMAKTGKAGNQPSLHGTVASTDGTNVREKDLLAIDIHLPPRSKECDVKIDVVGRPLDITLSPKFLLGIVDEFNVSQPLNLEALQDMLLESIGLLRKADQDLLTRSAKANQKEPPTLSLNLNLQIGTLFMPEDLCDLNKSVLAINLGEIAVSIQGHALEELRDETSDEDASYKYLPIDIDVRNFSATLLPKSNSEPLINDTDVHVSLLIVDAQEQLPSSMPNVQIGVKTAPVSLNLDGTTFNRLLQTIASTVLVIPTENLVPPDEKALVDSMRESGFDLFFERDLTQQALRRRMHKQSVKFVEFDEKVLNVLQEKVMMKMSIEIPSVQVICWRDPSTTAGASRRSELLHATVSGFSMQLRTQLYDTCVDMQIHDINAAATQIHSDGNEHKFNVISFDGARPDGSRDDPVFVLKVTAAKPLSAHFAELRGTSEVKLDFANYLRVNINRALLADLISFFVLNIPFEALQQMEHKTKTAKSLLFDPAEVLRRNRVKNGGVAVCRQTLEIEAGKFQHFFALSRVDISVHGIIVTALLDDCKSGFAEIRVRSMRLGLCRETQAMELQAQVRGLAVVDLTEAGAAAPTVVRAGAVHGRPQSPNLHGNQSLQGHAQTKDLPPFVDISMWMFDPFKGSPPDLYVKANIDTIIVTVLNRFVMGFVGYIADSRLQNLLQNLDQQVPKPEKFVATDHATGEPIPPKLILPDVDVTMHGITVTVPTYTGADTYAVMGINGIKLKNVAAASDPGSSERTEIAVAVDGIYTQLKCDGMRRLVDFLRIETVKTTLLMVDKNLTCKVEISPLQVCFSVDHFSAILGLLHNVKEQPQVSMSDHEIDLLTKTSAGTKPAEEAPDKSARPDVPAPSSSAVRAGNSLEFDIVANVRFGGIRCLLLQNLPRQLDGDVDATKESTSRISLFSIDDQPTSVHDAVAHETVSVLEMGSCAIDATVSGGGSQIDASVHLEEFKVLDRRPATLLHYEKLHKPPSSDETVGTHKGEAQSNYTASLQAFGTIIHLEGSKAEPFLNLELGVRMDPDRPGRLIGIDVEGSLKHCHITYSDLIMQVMTIFQPPELPKVPAHVTALLSKSVEAATAAAVVAAENASQLLDDALMVDLMRGALEINVNVAIASGGIHLLFSDEQGSTSSPRARSQEKPNTFYSVPAGFLLQWDDIYLRVKSRGLRNISVGAGLSGIRLGVRQVGLPLEDLEVPQQSRDIIPAFKVEVSLETKVDKARRKNLDELALCGIVDDLKGLQLSLVVNVSAIKAFVSSYIAMKAIKMLRAAESLFARKDKDEAASRTGDSADEVDSSRRPLLIAANPHAFADADEEAKKAYFEQASMTAESMQRASEAIKSARNESNEDLMTQGFVNETVVRNLGLSQLSVTARIELKGVSVFVAADLPTTNFGISLDIEKLKVIANVAKGAAALRAEWTLSSQFRQSLSQPFIETTKMVLKLKSSCVGVVPPEALAYQFPGPRQLQDFLQQENPLDIQFSTSEMLNINIRQNMISVAIHCIDGVVEFMEDIDASLNDVNTVSKSEALQQWEREKITLNVQTLRNDTGLPMKVRVSFAWNSGGVVMDWPSISLPAWRTLLPGDEMVVELPFFVYEKLVDQQIEVSFPHSSLLTQMGHSGNEVFSFSSYDLKTYTSSRSACVLALHGSHNFNVLSNRVNCVAGMELGMELRPVPSDVVKMILLNLRPGDLSNKSRLYSVVTSAAARSTNIAGVNSTFASAAAIKAGDYIFQVDGEFLPNSNDLQHIFDAHVASHTALKVDIIRQSAHSGTAANFADVKLVFEKQCGGAKLVLRSELSVRNDMPFAIELEFYRLQKASPVTWQSLPGLTVQLQPDNEHSVPFEAVLDGNVYVRSRPIHVKNLAFSPLYHVQTLCRLKLGSSAPGSTEQLPQPGNVEPASAQSMTPRRVEDAELVDQASVGFEVARFEIIHCIFDVRRDAIGTPQLSVVPAFRVQNLLPIDVNLTITAIEGDVAQASFKPVTLKPTQKVSMCHTDRNDRDTSVLVARLVGCPNLPGWSSVADKRSRLRQSHGIIILTDVDDNHLRLQFAATERVTQSKFFDVCLFAPFWVVNCTGFPFLYSAQMGSLSATAKPGTGPRKKRGTIKIKARNVTKVTDVMECLAAQSEQALAEAGLADSEAAPALQGQFNLTFLSDANMSKKKLSVRMKLEGTDSAWTSFIEMGHDAGATEVEIPCSDRQLQIKVNNVQLPALFARSKLIILQPRYVIFNDTDHEVSVRQLMSMRHRNSNAADGVNAVVHRVKPRSQSTFYFRDSLYSFVQFASSAAPDSWSGAVDIQALGYNEVSFGGPCTKKVYHRVEVFETRSIIYVKLAELKPQSVYTKICNSCHYEYVRIEQVLRKEGSKHISKDAPTTVHEADSGFTNIFAPGTDTPYVADHPTLPPVVDVVVLEPRGDAADDRFKLSKLGSVRVDLRLCSKETKQYQVAIPSDKGLEDRERFVVVTLRLVGGISELRIFRPDAAFDKIEAYMQQLNTATNNSKFASSANVNPLPAMFSRHKKLLRHAQTSNKPRSLLHEALENREPAEAPMVSTIQVTIRGLGVSIIADHSSLQKSQSYELLYVSLQDVYFQHDVDTYKRFHSNVQIGKFQIDSGAKGTNYPVLLYQYRHIREDQKAERAGEELRFFQMRILSEYHESIDYYQHINILMQAAVLKFDTPFLNEVLQLVDEVRAIACHLLRFLFA